MALRPLIPETSASASFATRPHRIEAAKDSILGVVYAFFWALVKVCPSIGSVYSCTSRVFP